MALRVRSSRWQAILGWMIIVLWLGTACSPKPEATAQSKPTITPPVFRSHLEDSALEPCDGSQTLRSFEIPWTRNERLVEELESSDWRYYWCPQSRALLAYLYRLKTQQPPYAWQEVIWVEEDYGTLGVYFDPNVQLWTYVWFLDSRFPASSSILVIVRAVPGFGGGCG